jgi:hypothetical protein
MTNYTEIQVSHLLNLLGYEVMRLWGYGVRTPHFSIPIHISPQNLKAQRPNDLITLPTGGS